MEKNQTTDATTGLIVETVKEPTLGDQVLVREVFVKDARRMLAAIPEGEHRGMSLLAHVMTVDGRPITVEEMENMPARKMGAIMRCVEVALRLNGLADKPGQDTVGDAVKNA